MSGQTRLRATVGVVMVVVGTIQPGLEAHWLVWLMCAWEPIRWRWWWW